VNGTSFVGREDELAQLTSLLSRARLITVTGTGGVGKTRLARQAATLAGSRFPDGVYIAELSALTDPGLLPNTVAAVLGLREQDTVSASHAILDYIRDRKILLVLDTCEHLIDACAALTETLLQEAAGVTVLATSRQPLDVAGETSFPLAPLEVPLPGAPPRPGDAVDLFARRAAAVVPTFSVTRENADDVIRLCRRLDGIPLAIELAAVRLRALPLKELASRVPLQATGQRGIDQRHQTLHAAIKWSYNLCTPAEKVLWERASVFAGSFAIAFAEEVCAGRDLPREDVLATLIGLVDKSVLVRENPVSQNAAVRYRLLDTIREFGLRRLGESGIEPGVRGRLVERYRTMAAYFGDHVLDDDQLDRFGELRDEHESIRSALEWSLGSSQASAEQGAEQGVALALSLFFYWHVAGRFREGIYWLDKILDARPGACADRMRALFMRCALAAPAGVGSNAIADGREAIRLAAGLGEPFTGARAAAFLQHALIMGGQTGEALERAADTERQLTAVQDRAGLAVYSICMTQLHQVTGDFGRSLEWYQRGMRTLGQGKERWASSWAHLLGGFTLSQLNRIDDAEEVWKLALAAKYELGDIAGIAYGLDVLAMAAWLAGHHERAAWLNGAADPLWDRAGGGVRLGGNPLYLGLYEAFIAEAREKIGTARANRLLDEGRGIPADQAVALAVSGADTLPGPGPAADRALTSREREVAALAGTGLSSRAIAERLRISKRTVEAHIEHIYAKLRVSSRVELATWLSTRDL
jgi:non-specific serine/threonine protein kinase